MVRASAAVLILVLASAPAGAAFHWPWEHPHYHHARHGAVAAPAAPIDCGAVRELKASPDKDAYPRLRASLSRERRKQVDRCLKEAVP